MTMATPTAASHWAELQRLFDGALDHVESERDSWIDAQTDDAGLRAEVRRLLDHHAGNGRPTAEYQHGAARLGTFAGDTDGAYGAWTLLSLAGHGGMGSVYLAERRFEGGTQRAALKLSHALLADAESARRLRAERAALAGIQHQGIARLIDAGETGEGRPWFAMEWVDGEPLLKAFARRQLPLRARIEVFRRICAALAHAHQRLVLHRDIKSGNVLLDATGAPHIVDFGIAKLLAQDATDATEASARFFTAHCAAPEQIAGGEATTAIDVYGVGALLYEALTGRPPLALDGARSPADVARIVQDVAPLAPSRAVTTAASGPDAVARDAVVAQARACGLRDAGALARALAGDLDRIVLHCLRKDPLERYRSIDELDADLQRWLAGLPVAAAGQSLLYRMRKLAWRHRVPLAAGLGAVAALSTLSASLAVQGIELRAERDRARQEQQRSELERSRADATTEFLVDAFQRADPRRAGSPTIDRRELVDSALQRLEAGYIDDPAILGRLAVALADVAQATGHREAVSRATTLYVDRVLAEGPPGAREQVELALLAGRLAANRDDVASREHMLRIASTAHAALPRPDAELAFRLGFQAAQYRFDRGDRAGALDAFTALRGRVPSGTREADRTLRLEIRIATALRTLGRTDESIAVLYRALAASAARDGTLPSTRVDARFGLATSLRQADRNAEALRYAREALDEATRIFGPDSTITTSIRSAVAASLGALGRHAESESLHREVVESYSRQLGPDDPSTLMASYNLLRTRILAHGIDPSRAAEATAVAARAERRWGAGHPNAQVMALLAAWAQHELGNHREARDRYATIVVQATDNNRSGLTAARAVLGIALVDAAADPARVDQAALVSALERLDSASDHDDPILSEGRALAARLLREKPLSLQRR